MSHNESSGTRERGSIRRRILALLWLAVLPLTALHLWSTYDRYVLAVDSASMEAFGLADAVATSAEQFLSTVEAQMMGAAERFAGPGMDAELCNARIPPLFEALGYLDNLGFQNDQGYTVCWTLPAEDLATAYFGDNDWFARVRLADGLVLDRPVLAPFSGTWVISVHVPVRDVDGSFVGSLSGTLSLARFQNLLGGVLVADDELVSIVTGDRVVVARSADPESFVGSEYPSGLETREEVGPGRWINRLEDFSGVDRTWAVVRLRSVDWDAVAGIPTARIRAPAVTATIRNWSLNAIIIVLVILLILSIHRRIVGSLADLVGSVRRVTQGSTVPLPERAPEEVATVVETLNRTLSERDRAQEGEREAETRFRSIVDNAVFGIYMATPDGRFLDVNPAMATMLGYGSPEELIKAGPVELYRDPEERRQLVEQHLHTDVIEDFETTWIRKDGQPITVRLNGRTISGEDQRPVFQMIVEDITRSKALDEQLRQTQKMEAIGRLAGGVAHDFNNLLTVISLNGEFLLAETDDDDRHRAELLEIAEAARRAEALTGQLLAFSRNEKEEAEILDPNEVVQGLEKMLSRLLTESIRVDTVLAPDVPRVRVDRGRLEQVIVNLVVNARDAMPHGGRIGLHTSVGGRPVGAPADHGGRWICIAVDDEGVGMDEETLTHVFEPFFTTKPPGEGSGLGLATAYGIAHAMGGHIAATSEPGVGSRFEIWLPGVDQPATTVGPNDERPRRSQVDPVASSRGESILVVEDEAQIRRVVERMLSHAGYQVLLARDGQEAVTLASDESIRIDLVITDVVMPRMHGPDLAEQLQRLRPGTPVLFVSGHTFELPVRTRVDSEHFLAKPFSAAVLRAKVRALLDEASARAQPGSDAGR